MIVQLYSLILIADEPAMVRRGLRLILDAEPDLEVTAEASDGRQAVQCALREELDLAVLDVSMPRLTGLQAASELERHKPDLKILMLSMHDDEQYFFEALRAGASGYVLKSAADRDLVEACRAALRGEPFAYPSASGHLIRSYLAGELNEQDLDTSPLTRRELEVLKMVAEGFSSREIGSDLAITEKTVDRHRANILEKLGMHDRVELTRYAIRRGLVDP